MADKLIRNLDHRSVLHMADLVDYKPGKVASLTLTQNPGVGITLFAIDKGEGLSTHSAPGDAMAQVLEGKVEITIDGVTQTLTADDTIVMPAEVPHALQAVEPFKFLLVVVKMEGEAYRWKFE